MSNMSVNEAWELLFKKYDIYNHIKEHGAFYITAKQIKEFKEPRLMAKWDSSEMLPKIFKHYKVNILPVSRSEYVLSDICLYEPIPELGEYVTEMKRVEIPDYETIDINQITSEANAINVLMLSHVLDDFLGEPGNVVTFNGRMGTGSFNFSVNRFSSGALSVGVNNAQCEIDGGMENSHSVVILEAKNVVHPDFHIRQLYYPYRLWSSRVKKPIRLVFSVYSNQIYRLFEYEFMEHCNYSSIRLVQSKNYSLQDTNISMDDLYSVYKKTKVTYDDNKNHTETPFIQANSFERVISLLEMLWEQDRSTKEIANIMQFDLRQSDYYYNAGRYLGLFKKISVEGEGRSVTISLSPLGKKVVKLPYKKRQLELVGLILQHRLFYDLFPRVYREGIVPTREEIQGLMRQYQVCNEGQIERRSSTVYAWLQWMIHLTNI